MAELECSTRPAPPPPGVQQLSFGKGRFNDFPRIPSKGVSSWLLLSIRCGREGFSEPFIVGVVLVTFFRCRGDMDKVDCEGHIAQVGAHPSRPPLCLARLLDWRLGGGVGFRKWGEENSCFPSPYPAHDGEQEDCVGGM